MFLNVNTYASSVIESSFALMKALQLHGQPDERGPALETMETIVRVLPGGQGHHKGLSAKSFAVTLCWPRCGR